MVEMDLNNNEIKEILKNGSTNQKNFINSIEKNNTNFNEVLNSLEELEKELESEIRLRDWLNGGVLRFETLTKDIKENNLYIEFNNNKGVVIY